MKVLLLAALVSGCGTLLETPNYTRRSKVSKDLIECLDTLGYEDLMLCWGQCVTNLKAQHLEGLWSDEEAEWLGAVMEYMVGRVRYEKS